MSFTRISHMGSLTIAQRLWLGLALILGLFASADLISLWAARKVDLTLRDLVKTAEERRDAGYDMRDSLAAFLSAVQTYASIGLPQQRSAIGQTESVFLQALAHYQAVALTQRSQTFSQTTTTGFNAVKGEAQRVIALADQQAHALDTLSTHQRTVDALLRKMPAVVAPARQSPPMRKRLVARALEDELRLAARPLPERIKVAGGALRGQLSGERAAFATTLMRYHSLAETAAERAFANAAATWYSTNLLAAQPIVQSEADKQRALVMLSATAQALDVHLATALQPNARAELSAAVEQASGIAHHANTLITRGLLVALVLGALAAMITVRAVRAPLGRLLESSRRLAEGDLAHRVAWSSKDELGTLMVAFNDMAAKLEASTVSRSYLESIVNNVAHPLFVVSERGIIQTANRAAEHLLEYEQGELVGKPLVSIVSTDLVAASTASDHGVAHTNATLMPTTGIPVPVAVSAVQMRTGPRGAPALVCIAQDLRERMHAEQHRRQTEMVFENSTEGIILTDAKRDILVVNPAFVRITGQRAEDVKGMSVSSLWSDREGSQCGAAVWDEVEAQEQWQGEMSIRHRDGQLRSLWMNVSLVRDSSGQIANLVVVFSDLTAIKAAEQRLTYLAHYDALTDLPNQALLAVRLRVALERAQGGSNTVAVLYVDLDEFKQVNDTLGHKAGDLLVQEMARRLPGCVRAKDTIGRLSGDAFIVVLPDVVESAQAARVAEAILECISAPYSLSGLELRMSASIGISLAPSHGATSEELLKAADAAMHRAKQTGGGCYQFFSEELTQHAMERLTLRNALRHPNVHDQLTVHYQPQVSVITGRIVAVEALVRWQHPVRGLLSPTQFIQVAEEAGLIQIISDYVLTTACAQARLWQDRGPFPLRVAVNISAYELSNPTLVQRVRDVLSHNALDPALLELEVTEGALQTGDGAVEVLRKLKSVGVRLALDDFGTGYSSLASLKSLPIDSLKIDRSFIRDLQHNENDRSLTQAIIAMAHSLKLGVVAEGVETPTQMSFLRAQGCDEVQGYLLAPPMSAGQLDSQYPQRIADALVPRPRLVARNANCNSE